MGGLLLSSSLFVPFVFLVRYATDQGISDRSAALLLSFLGASNIVSRLVTTGLASRVGAVRMFMLCFGLLPVGFVVWLASGDTYVGLVLFAVVLGVSHGGVRGAQPRGCGRKSSGRPSGRFKPR